MATAALAGAVSEAICRENPQPCQNGFPAPPHICLQHCFVVLK